jgi:predicted methyltransferase
MKKILLASLFLVSFTTAMAEATENGLLARAIAGTHRSEQHKFRDQYRHPLQTLRFFEVDADMTVVEIWPGGKGWYTEILAPYLKPQGVLYAAHFSANSGTAYFTKSLAQFKEKMSAQPERYGNVILTQLHAPDALAIAPVGSADRVLTFRNVHNWMKKAQADAVFTAMYQALKPGGILGVVEHRAPANSHPDTHALSGYVTEAYVIALAEKAGFRFLASSAINANPKDSAKHPKGVWTLPPTLKLKEQDKEKYLAIGESDRMTLKFIKP